MKRRVVVIPVADVDRAKPFYERLRWSVEAEVAASDVHLAQMTPAGSAGSIQFGHQPDAGPTTFGSERAPGGVGRSCGCSSGRPQAGHGELLFDIEAEVADHLAHKAAELLIGRLQRRSAW